MNEATGRKLIYFVRHGESEANASPVFIDGDSPLTERGRSQAAFVGSRLAKLPIDALITSTLTRAKETGHIVNEHFNLDITETELLSEWQHASEEVGLERGSEAWHELYRKIREAQRAGDGPYADEEAGDEMFARAGAALEYLKEQPGTHIVAVTHSLFLRALLAYTLLGGELSATATSFDFYARAGMHNTGVSIFEYTEERGWRLITWNDYSHLPA